jgi:hypothetical protein
MATTTNGSKMNRYQRNCIEFSEIKYRKLPAFTIFEVVMVLAIMSCLVAIVSASINRLGEQVKTAQEIQQDLTKFYEFRSNLWRECILSDSITNIHHGIQLWKDGIAVQYKSEGGDLQRSTDGSIWRSTGFTVIESKSSMVQTSAYMELQIQWKAQEINFRFPKKATLKQRIDSYFLPVNQ